MAVLILALSDLQNRIGPDRCVQYFDDDGDGVVIDADAAVVQVLEQAEGQYFSRMQRAYPSRSTQVDLANNDAVVKGHIIWIACELASERRIEFTDAEGWGAYKVQYERALKELDMLSKGQTRSQGEEVTGQGANTGGQISPKPPVGARNQFVFASSKKRPGGTGGF